MSSEYKIARVENFLGFRLVAAKLVLYITLRVLKAGGRSVLAVDNGDSHWKWDTLSGPLRSISMRVETTLASMMFTSQLKQDSFLLGIQLRD